LVFCSPSPTEATAADAREFLFPIVESVAGGRGVPSSRYQKGARQWRLTNITTLGGFLTLVQ